MHRPMVKVGLLWEVQQNTDLKPLLSFSLFHAWKFLKDKTLLFAKWYFAADSSVMYIFIFSYLESLWSLVAQPFES